MSSENSTIIAFIFSGQEISSEIYEGIHRLHNAGDIDLLDVCEFDVKENGKIKFERAMTLPLIGDSDEIFLEAFVGLLFFHAPHNNNVEQAIGEMHLNQKFIRDLVKKAVPGSSVLFLHVKNAASSDMLKKISREAIFGTPKVQETLALELTPEQESKLEILFHGKSPAETTAADLSLH